MKKVAITISGAVSLGAYEAGVMYELSQAFQSHNSRNPQGTQIQIDVLTGASAGGMTAVILAQKLLFQPDRLQDVTDNDLYLPWVKDIGLTPLLKQGVDEQSDLSILSSDLIEAISKQYLISPFAAGGAASPSPVPHPAAAPKVKLGLAMSNLNGIDYGLSLLSGGAMPYTRFQDELRRDVDSTNPAHNSAIFWEPIRNAAVACGAFPFAFRVKEVLRGVSEYQDPVPLKFPATGMEFAYTDGGTFQNEPIGLAKQLVDEIDQHMNDERYYLFIAPGMRQSASNDLDSSTDADCFNYWATGKSLINAIFNQARYRDLEQVEKINDQVAQFDAQAAGLKELFIEKKVNADCLLPATAPLLQSLFPDAAAADASRARLRTQFADEYAQIAAAVGSPNADSWIDAILLLESTASLGARDSMKVFAITEDADKLAGDDLFAFGGFFDRSYRQHDYDRGRQSVRDFIAWLNAQQNSGLGPIDYPIADLPPISIDTSLDGLKVSVLPLDKREALRDRLHERIHIFMDKAGIPFAIRQVIDIGYLNGFLKTMLSL